jgi:hypothetical protein
VVVICQSTFGAVSSAERFAFAASSFPACSDFSAQPA